jgi:hypothetical protein
MTWNWGEGIEARDCRILWYAPSIRYCSSDTGNCGGRGLGRGWEREGEGGIDLDAGVGVEGGRDGLERGVELRDARLGQEVHEVQAGEDGLVLGVRDDEFVVEVNGFDLGNVPLECVHVADFKAQESAELERVKNNLRFLREVRGRRGGGGRREQRRD